MENIRFVIVNSELGAGTRGASLGVGAMQSVARSKDDFFFGIYPTIKVPVLNEMLDEDTSFPYAKRIDGILQVYKHTANAVQDTLKANAFPLVLAGDHSTAAATISGIRMAYPDKKLGVVWIDAHGDLHTPYTTPSGNMHGMPLAVCLAEDNLENKINEPAEDSKRMWEDMKNLGGIIPKIHAEDLVFISVRDTEKPEDDLMRRKGIKNYTVAELREKTKEVVFEEIKSKLASCDLVYISFDVDSMDCEEVSRGTGTPVENGLMPNEARYFLNEFALWDKVCCMEVVEVNPCLDNKINRMAEVAFDLTKEFTNHIQNRIG